MILLISYKINIIRNVNETYYNFNDDIALNKTSNNYYNDTYNITNNNNLFNTTDNQYSTEKIHTTSNITNNITKHINNNYEHNVIKKVNTHIQHINNYDTEMNYYTKKSLNIHNYYNFYHDTFNFRKIENISLSQQTDVTNNITETNNQTIHYVDDNYLNDNKIATIVLNPTPSLTDNYLWIPEVCDNVVAGLDSLITYLQSKYATINALQTAINNINNTINNEIVNIQTEINNLEITNQQHVSKDLHYHTSHTDFMYQRNNTNNDNRRSFITQQNYFTYQRKGNQELQIQLLNNIVADLQNQINNINTSSPPPDNNDPDVGTM